MSETRREKTKAGTSIRLMDYVDNWDDPLNVASLASLTLIIEECDSEADAVNSRGDTIKSEALTPISDYVFDVPVVDSRWTRDTVGYNFRYQVQPEEIPNGGKWYRFDFECVPVDGPPFLISWIIFAEPRNVAPPSP